MRAAPYRVFHRHRVSAPELLLDADACLRRVRRSNAGRHAYDAGRRRYRLTARVRIWKGRIGNDHLAQPRAVEQERSLGGRLGQIIVEDSCATSQDGLLLCRSEGKTKSWREVVAVPRRRLPVVTQAKCE